MQNEVTYYTLNALETLLSSAQELIDKEYLSKEEANQIMNQRQNYEYSLLSTTSTQENYLKYIQFEMNLLNLIETRWKLNKLIKLSKKDKILNHINGIFERSLKKFRRDEHLWKTFIDFAIAYNFRIEYTLESSLIANPDNKDLWLLAAKWHLECNSSPKSARVLLQRAVKLLPNDEQLWLSLFKLEAVNSLSLKNFDVNSFNGGPVETSVTSLPSFKPLLVVLEQIQKNTEFRRTYSIYISVLSVLAELENTEEIQNQLLLWLVEIFSKNEDCLFECCTWKWRRYCSVNDTENKKGSSDEGKLQLEVDTTNALLQAAKSLRTSDRMWELCIQFAMERLQHYHNVEVLQKSSRKQNKRNEMVKIDDERMKFFYLDLLLNEIFPSFMLVIQEASRNGVNSKSQEDNNGISSNYSLGDKKSILVAHYVKLLFACDVTPKAMTVLTEAIHLDSFSFNLWRLHFELKLTELSLDKVKSVMKTFNKGMELLSYSERKYRQDQKCNLSCYLADKFIAQQQEQQHCYDFISYMLKENPQSTEIKTIFLNYCRETHQDVNRYIELMMKFIPHDWEIWKMMIDELSISKSREMINWKLLEKILKVSLMEHGSSNPEASKVYKEFESTRKFEELFENHST